jgi:hypothetical protein
VLSPLVVGFIAEGTGIRAGIATMAVALIFIAGVVKERRV